MRNSVWNKKAVAIITAAAFVGVLSPISASAWDSSDGPDEIVTAYVDLGSGNNGGGGGDPETCTGFASLTVPSSSVPLTFERTIEKYVSTWTDTDGVDTNADNIVDNDPRPNSDIDVRNENTDNKYSSEEFTISYDADNCPSSTEWAGVNFERQPVERYESFSWSVAELVQADGILAADALRATANLVLNRGIVNGNNVSSRAFYSLPWEDSSDDREYLNNWGTVYDDNLDGLEEVQGTHGDVNMKATMSIFGDEPKGKYRVKYGMTLWVGY